MPGSSRLPISLPQLRTRYSLRHADTRQRLLHLLLDYLGNALLLLLLLRYARTTLRHLRGYGLLGSLRQLLAGAYRRLYALFLRLPVVRDRVQADVAKALSELEAKLVPSGPGVVKYTALPAAGWSAADVRTELSKLGSMEHTSWEHGRVSGAVYHGGPALSELQSDAFKAFGVANPIHPDVFPGVRKMEAEIVAMTLTLFNAPPATGAGVTTAGGTESILMAVLAARQKASAERGVKEPEMVIPETAHPAFRKAGAYFNIRVHLAPCPAPTYRVHIPSVSRLINSNTVLIVASAPNFPHGIVDDIPALSRLALSRHRGKLPLHVDCCLGSFLMPFLSRAGFPAPEFDFRLPGVTSISVDTHKYGFAPKGNSVLLYRTKALRRYQYFVSPDWSGGVYASPGIAGSRPGALIAGCWASMVKMGEDGYLEACVKIVGAAKRIEEAVRASETLRRSVVVLGKPLVSVVAFRAPPHAANDAYSLDIYDLADAMSAKGWHLNALQSPPAIHVAVTLPIVAAVEDLIRDLEECVERVRGASAEGEGKGKGDAAALYGVAGALPDKRVVRELAEGFLDCLYVS